MSKITPRAPRRKLTVQPGDRIGRGVVVEEVRVSHSQAATQRGARMLCDCGTVYEVSLGNLLAREQPTRSCGCLPKDASRERVRSKAPGRSGPQFVHGLSRTHPLYKTWQNMMTRCYNPENKGYPTYGGRGIKVCMRWHDPVCFTQDIARLIGPRPGGYSLDRYPDNNGNYEEGNVRWADPVEQARNSRNYRDGRAGKRLYHTWYAMLRHHPDEVCKRWRGFPAFEEDVSALDPSQGPGMCLIRIDMRQSYGPSNVRWITRAEFQRFLSGWRQRRGSQFVSQG